MTNLEHRRKKAKIIGRLLQKLGFSVGLHPDHHMSKLKTKMDKLLKLIPDNVTKRND